jgi:putative transposase
MSVVVITVKLCHGFRLLPTDEQEEALLGHCRDARYVWNLAVEQQRHWQPGRKAPGYVQQCAQLTEARAEYAWLRAGSQTVQQQALRDFAQAMRNFLSGTHRRPTWRKAGVHEGFRQVALKPRHVERVNRRFGRVWVPKSAGCGFACRVRYPQASSPTGSPVIGLAAGMWRSPTFLTPSPVQSIAAWLVSTAALRWPRRCRPVNCCTPLA